MARYRIIDEMLSDPSHNYTTEEIYRAVLRECPSVTLRMIQKDIKNIGDEFGQFKKKLIRNAGGRGTVKYADQSEPIFYKDLTWDEEEVLREVLKSLGQFDGLDNFTWMELLKKKLEVKDDGSQQPIISFSKNEGLQMPPTLLGRLFTAISRKKVIRITYTPFASTTKQYVVYPYMLKQYNNRWFLLCTPLADDVYPFNPYFVASFALDRMDGEFDYMNDIPYLESPVDFKARFEEIVGVTLYADQDVEDIYFAVKPKEVPYVRTKYLHITQIELDGDSQKHFRERYPSLSDCTFFSIECRPNHELLSLFASYMDAIVLVEPTSIRDELQKKVNELVAQYKCLGKAK